MIYYDLFAHSRILIIIMISVRILSGLKRLSYFTNFQEKKIMHIQLLQKLLKEIKRVLITWDIRTLEYTTYFA